MLGLALVLLARGESELCRDHIDVLCAGGLCKQVQKWADVLAQTCFGLGQHLRNAQVSSVVEPYTSSEVENVISLLCIICSLFIGLWEMYKLPDTRSKESL